MSREDGGAQGTAVKAIKEVFVLLSHQRPTAHADH